MKKPTPPPDIDHALAHLLDKSRPPLSTDLVSAVAVRLGPASSPEASIDRFYEQGRGDDPELLRLAQVVAEHSQPPAPIDLTNRVLASLDKQPRASRRLPAGTIELDRAGRSRIWWWVCAGHVAAAALLLTFRPANVEPIQIPVDNQGASQHAYHANPTPLLERRTLEQRRLARSAAALPDLEPLMASAVSWLISMQSTGGTQDGRLSPLTFSDPDRALGVHAYALLAIMGEGADQPERALVIQRGVAWMMRQAPPQDPTVLAVTMWAKVEASGLIDDPILRQRVAQELAVLSPQPPQRAQLPTLMAFETAWACGLLRDVGPCLALRTHLFQVDTQPDIASQGIHGLALHAAGLGSLDKTKDLRHTLMNTQVDKDPFALLPAALTMAHGTTSEQSAWKNTHLASMIALFVPAANGGLMVPEASVRWGHDIHGGSIAATAWTMLCLQAPYRTLKR